MPFKMHKIIFFSRKISLKKTKKKQVCVPTLPKIFRPVAQNTLIFFYLALVIILLLLQVISGHLGWVRCLAVEPGNQWFVTGAADRVIKVRDQSIKSGSK